MITSTQNPRIKEVVRLRTNRERKQSGLVLIDGERETARALAAGVKIVELYFSPDAARRPPAGDLIEVVQRAGVELIDVSEHVFEKIAYGDRHEGFVAVAERPRRSLAEVEPGPTPLIAIVEGVEKPGNLGAILRTADAAGLDALIAADARTDVYGPNVIRASLGAVFSVPVVEASAAEAAGWLRARGVRVVAASPMAQNMYSDADFRGPTAFVFGAEATGLSSVWSAEQIEAVAIPMLGRVDSLNVSAAAAILFYEARRQRGRE